MRTFARFVTFCSLAAGIHSAAFACGASYNAATGAASVPCFDSALEGRSSSVLLQSSGSNTFVLSTTDELTVADPVIAELRILTSPTPTAILTGFYAACGGSVSKPTFTRIGNNVDIRVKMRLPSTRDWACEAGPWAMRPFAEAIRLVTLSDPQTQTYSVNGRSIEPVF